ncbi:hypothetical protein L226DRAFT_573624 [Lentinus tigrinus ALCF2SS1-7]|uniref:Uncharacterized protein n=1 Tax=Lentinus tigrinus ALCF2SS1-6 TaxID=1328759 RepID=A0A5C2S2H6_9APHY|nr:hypothetical protein L227DRAFT_613375 [Lentinus tigrinus ALCF2SS1-6]RPD71964.1 hypothetical protein L226DRAFT_573624 [Lentinus tigrinus ALCF2SS1-7]
MATLCPAAAAALARHARTRALSDVQRLVQATAAAIHSTRNQHPASTSSRSIHRPQPRPQKFRSRTPVASATHLPIVVFPRRDSAQVVQEDSQDTHGLPHSHRGLSAARSTSPDNPILVRQIRANLDDYLLAERKEHESGNEEHTVVLSVEVENLFAGSSSTTPLDGSACVVGWGESETDVFPLCVGPREQFNLFPSYPTKVFPSRWNCVLDLASSSITQQQKRQSAELEDG